MPCRRPTLTPGGHDGDAGPSPLQGAQPLLILSQAVDAGGIEVQAHVPIVPQKLSHTLGTISTGAPGEKAGDPVLVFRVQFPGLDPLQQEGLRMAREHGVRVTLGTQEAGKASVIGGEHVDGGTRERQGGPGLRHKMQGEPFSEGEEWDFPAVLPGSRLPTTG